MLDLRLELIYNVNRMRTRESFFIRQIKNDRSTRSATERNNKMKVTKDTLIGDILDYDVETARFFFEIGMHCLGCPHSRGESIEEACLVHGTNADELVEKINNYLASK